MKERPIMMWERYMQPIAVHRTHAERLLLNDDEGRCFLWIGEAGADPAEIPDVLAHYLMHRHEMRVLEARERMWFVAADLPVRYVPTNPEIPEQEYLV